MMRQAEAAWVRAHVWPRALASALGPTESCPCQYGRSSWCMHGNCRQCHTPEPVAMPETYITDRAGLVCHAPDFRGGHPAVWLADRVCRWRCPCDCHAAEAAPRHSYVQPELFTEMEIAS